MFYIYLIESLPEVDKKTLSATNTHRDLSYKDWFSSKLIEYIPHFASTSFDFTKEIKKFLKWQNEITLKKDEIIILWLSVHGTDEVHIGEFDDDIKLNYLEVFGSLHKKLKKETVIMLHTCWGAYPGITRVMNHSAFGPSLIFGPRVEVYINPLTRAEKETFKFLAENSLNDITEEKLIKHIDNINAWGVRNKNKYKNHESYYRAWFWGDRNFYDIRQYPRCKGKLINEA